MKKFFRLLFILSSIIWINTFALEKQDDKNLSQKYGHHKIAVSQKMPRSKTVRGILPSKDTVSHAAKKFYDALDNLPSGFVKRSGLKYVTFLEKPTLKGIPVGGVACGDTIVLSVSFSEKTVYHELFHIFDPPKDNKKWQRLNNRKFIYTGSDYYSEKLSARKDKRKELNLSSGLFDSDFVSRYAMSNEREDRAETFAFMVCEKKDFLKGQKKAQCCYKK